MSITNSADLRVASTSMPSDKWLLQIGIIAAKDHRNHRSILQTGKPTRG
jgi:hypothetical protein